MSSTPLFDSVARRRERLAPTPAVTTAPADQAPTSPLSAPVDPAHSTAVSAALVAAIDSIPAHVAPAVVGRFRVEDEQLALVEAVADALTRAVVDAVVHELDRIVRDRVVRA